MHGCIVAVCFLLSYYYCLFQLYRGAHPSDALLNVTHKWPTKAKLSTLSCSTFVMQVSEG